MGVYTKTKSKQQNITFPHTSPPPSRKPRTPKPKETHISVLFIPPKAILSPVHLIVLHPRLVPARVHIRTRHAAPPPSLVVLMRLLRLQIVDQQLTVLSVASGLVVRNADDVEDIRRLVEDLVHLLERAVRGLGVEEVDAGDDEGVDDGEDDVGLVADCVEGDGRDHDDHEVEGPVGGRRERVCRRADPQGHDFGRVEPGHAEPADGELGGRLCQLSWPMGRRLSTRGTYEGVEDEEECSRYDTGGIAWIGRRAC